MNVSDVHEKVKRGWNSGTRLKDVFAIVNRRGQVMTKTEIVRQWKCLRDHYGCGSIPMRDFGEHWSKPKEPRDPEYRRWLGLDGPGKMLREIIAAENQRTRERGAQ